MSCDSQESSVKIQDGRGGNSVLAKIKLGRVRARLFFIFRARLFLPHDQGLLRVRGVLY